jgi:hypothetical protein
VAVAVEKTTSSASSVRAAPRGTKGNAMKKKRKTLHAARNVAFVAERTLRSVREEPSTASLREIPQVDFSKVNGVRSNPYLERIRKAGGYTVAIDGRKPYFVRVGAGRPKSGEKREPTATRSVRLPATLWNELRSRAKTHGTNVNAEISAAILATKKSA